MPVSRPDPFVLNRIKRALLDSSYASLGNRRTDSVHEFYRYPARFTAGFASAAIDAFSRPGDLVLDPFLGGGTTVVEALSGGRAAIGSDLNQLALFVSTAKSTLYSEASLERVRDWADEIPVRVRLNRQVPIDSRWAEAGYLRHLGSPQTWRLRNAIALAIDTLSRFDNPEAAMLARCAILRTAQVALDARREPLRVREFRDGNYNPE